MTPAVVNILLLSVPLAFGVLHGDEEYRNFAKGKFYVFCNGDSTLPSIDIVDPETLTVTKSIPVSGMTEWADAVYMERCDDKSTFVFANDRSDGVYVVDALAQRVNSRIPISDRPVHSYGMYTRQEFWTHADGDGYFDVISLQDTSKLSHEDIVAHISVPGHGKLLWDPDLGNTAYASNVGEAGVFQLDLETKAITRMWNFTDYSTGHPLHCPGTHGLAYSKVNKHVYATCTSGVGLIELDSVNFGIITRHDFATGGQAYESPDEKYIVTIDRGNNLVHIIRPNENGALSSQAFDSINATAVGSAGKSPDKVAFHTLADGTLRIFFSLVGPASESSGVGWFDTKDLDNGGVTNLNNIAGGGVSGNHRAINDGGGFIATPMTVPFSGIMIIDAESGTLKGRVPTNSNPQRIVWVPEEYTGLTCGKDGDDDNELTSGQIAGIVVGALVGSAVVVFILICVVKSYRSNSKKMDVPKHAQNLEEAKEEVKEGSMLEGASVTGV